MHKYLLVLFTSLCFLSYSFSQDSLKVKSVDSVKQIVPAELLFKRSTQHNFSISPDGKYFAEVIDNNIENDLVIIDIDKYELHHRIPMGKNSIQNVYWLNSNRLLYESLGAIMAIDIDGSNKTTIVSRIAEKLPRDFYKFYKGIRFNSLISMLPSNSNEILIESFDYRAVSTVKRVNIYTGQKIVVLNGKKHDIQKWITDAKGEVRFGLRYGEEDLTYLYKNNVSGEWEQFYIVIDEIEYPLIISATSYLNQNISFEGFGYDTNIIYLTSNVGSDRRKLISYNLNEKKVEQVILENVNCDIYDPHGNDISLIFDPFTKSIAGVRYDGITPLFRWYSDRFRKMHTDLNAQYPGFINDVIDYDASLKRLLIFQWSAKNAGNIGVYDSKDNSYSIMFYFNKELNKYELTNTKNIIIPARDDFKIPCYLNLPTNYSDDNLLPLVVIPHGGPWSRDYWEFNEFSQYFATRGFATLRVNFRGSTGFGKKHVMAGVKSIDKIMINDIADAVNYVADNYKIDRQRIFIFGHSYGGYATYMSLIKYPKLYASGVALSAPTDLKAWMKKQKKQKDYFTYEFWTSALGNNQSKFLANISPINHIEKINNPLLIFHGKKDEVISVEHSENMVLALEKAKKNVRFEILQSEGHSISDGNSLGYILDTAKRFFEETGKDY